MTRASSGAAFSSSVYFFITCSGSGFGVSPAREKSVSGVPRSTHRGRGVQRGRKARERPKLPGGTQRGGERARGEMRRQHGRSELGRAEPYGVPPREARPQEPWRRRTRTRDSCRAQPSGATCPASTTSRAHSFRRLGPGSSEDTQRSQTAASTTNYSGASPGTAVSPNLCYSCEKAKAREGPGAEHAAGACPAGGCVHANWGRCYTDTVTTSLGFLSPGPGLWGLSDTPRPGRSPDAGRGAPRPPHASQDRPRAQSWEGGLAGINSEPGPTWAPPCP